MGVNAGAGPGNLFVADAAMIVDDVDSLPAVVSQIVLLLEKVLLVDMLPEARAEGFTAENTGPGAPVIPR